MLYLLCLKKNQINKGLKWKIRKVEREEKQKKMPPTLVFRMDII